MALDPADVKRVTDLYAQSYGLCYLHAMRGAAYVLEERSLRVPRSEIFGIAAGQVPLALGDCQVCGRMRDSSGEPLRTVAARLRRLAVDPLPEVRAGVAAHLHASVADLDALAHDESVVVRRCAASNLRLSRRSERRLVADADPGVRQALRDVTRTARGRRLEALGTDPRSDVRRRVAGHPRLTAEMAARLSNDEDDSVRWTLVGNPDLPESLREQWAKRFEAGSAPTPLDQGLPRILLLGPFGVGKSALLGQLLGTAGERPSFPAVSPGRTTVASMEVMCVPGGEYGVEAVFLARHRVEEAVERHMIEACRRALVEMDEAAIWRAVVGDSDAELRLESMLGSHDPLSGANTFADVLIASILDWAGSSGLRRSSSISDQTVHHARDFSSLVKKVLEEIVSRITSRLADGDLRCDHTGWPVRWAFRSGSRSRFMAQLRLVSQHRAVVRGAALGDPLVTPLVSQIRVSGPFKPSWARRVTPMVIEDTKGLGHSNGGPALSHDLMKRIAEADMIVLVDRGAGGRFGELTMEALEHVVMADAVGRLHMVVTKMDQVLLGGGDIQEFADAEEHVLASMIAASRSLARTVGKKRADALEQRLLGDHTHFGYELQCALDETVDMHQETILQLNDLLTAVKAAARVDGR